jgi:WD40 repeat protein
MRHRKPLGMFLPNGPAEGSPADGTRFCGHKGDVTCLAFTPDGKFLLSGSKENYGSDSAVRLWDLKSGKELQRFEGHLGGVNALACSPDGHHFVSAGGSVMQGMLTPRHVYDGAIRLWDLKTGRELRRFGSDLHIVSSLAFSPDSRWILAGSMERGSPVCLRLFDFGTGNEVRRLGEHPVGVNTVSFSPTGRYILCGTADMEWPKHPKKPIDHAIRVRRSLRLWDVHDFSEIERFDYQKWVNGIGFSPDKRWIVSGSFDETLLWDVESGLLVRRYTVGSNCVAVSPMGHYFVTGGGWRDEMLSPWHDCHVRIWDIDNNRELCRLEGHESKIATVAVSRDDDCVASGSKFGEIILWRLPRGLS